MKVELHRAILDCRRYSCRQCGRGCRRFLIPVSAAERERIEELTDWRKKLPADDLFMRHRVTKSGWALEKRSDGACVFLDEDNLCAIHKLYGLAAKPLACQLFPFVLTPFGDTLRVGLRFDCPAVCEGGGLSLTRYRKELNGLANRLIGSSERGKRLPQLRPGVSVSANRLEAVNETIAKVVADNTIPIRDRLDWLRLFADHLERLRWRKIGDEDCEELLTMLQGGLLAELRRRQKVTIPVSTKARRMLGQYLFFLCQPPDADMRVQSSLIERFRMRMGRLRAMRQLGQRAGELPKMQNHWPDCDMSELENNFGHWPEGVQELIGRYITCRVGGMNYFGANFYDYSLVEGLRSMLLGIVTISWVMRIEAVKVGRRNITLDDAIASIMTVDGNLGYSKALGFGPARLRLRYLANNLEGFLDCYC